MQKPPISWALSPLQSSSARYSSLPGPEAAPATQAFPLALAPVFIWAGKTIPSSLLCQAPHSRHDPLSLRLIQSPCYMGSRSSIPTPQNPNSSHWPLQMPSLFIKNNTNLPDSHTRLQLPSPHKLSSQPSCLHFFTSYSSPSHSKTGFACIPPLSNSPYYSC